MSLEKDELEIMGGVRFGETLGSPVAIVIRNTEWPKWQEEMSAEPGTSRRPLQTPRPGHADLAGMIKYDTRDARNILERASARETAARTIVGYFAKELLKEVGVQIVSQVVAIGAISAPPLSRLPSPDDADRLDESPVRNLDEATEAAMIAAIDAAKEDRNTLGGVFEVLAYGVPVGIGSHVHWDRRLDGALAEALMSIQAIKGVEIGDGYWMAGTPGSDAHDEIYHSGEGFHRATNHAGGIEGGMSIGDVIRVRAAMKPISTVMRPLDTVNVASKEPEKAFRERSDVSAVPAAAIVGEQMVAYVLAREIQRKFGGDTVAELKRSVAAYRKQVAEF
jgi:chorismate synthase